MPTFALNFGANAGPGYSTSILLFGVPPGWPFLGPLASMLGVPMLPLFIPNTIRFGARIRGWQVGEPGLAATGYTGAIVSISNF